MTSGGSVFNGIYQWRGDRLVVVQPDDKRMDGLTWKWQDGRLTVISEPAGTPTGSSYLGSKMERLEDLENSDSHVPQTRNRQEVLFAEEFSAISPSFRPF